MVKMWLPRGVVQSIEATGDPMEYDCLTLDCEDECCTVVVKWQTGNVVVELDETKVGRQWKVVGRRNFTSRQT